MSNLCWLTELDWMMELSSTVLSWLWKEKWISTAKSFRCNILTAISENKLEICHQCKAGGPLHPSEISVSQGLGRLISHSENWDWTWCCKGCSFDEEGVLWLWRVGAHSNFAQWYPFFQSLFKHEGSLRCTLLQFQSIWYGAYQMAPLVCIPEHLELDCWWHHLGTQQNIQPWAVGSFFPELHAASSWLRSFGTAVHYGEDQGFNHEAQAPRITPLGLKTLLWQACQGRLFRLYRALLVDLRVMQCFFLKINPSIAVEINKQEGPPEWGSNGKSKSDATMKNDSR